MVVIGKLVIGLLVTFAASIWYQRLKFVAVLGALSTFGNAGQTGFSGKRNLHTNSKILCKHLFFNTKHRLFGS